MFSVSQISQQSAALQQSTHHHLSTNCQMSEAYLAQQSQIERQKCTNINYMTEVTPLSLSKLTFSSINHIISVTLIYTTLLTSKTIKFEQIIFQNLRGFPSLIFHLFIPITDNQKHRRIAFFAYAFCSICKQKRERDWIVTFFVGLLCWLEFPSRTDESWHLCDFWQQFSHDVNQQKNLLLCAKDNLDIQKKTF